MNVIKELRSLQHATVRRPCGKAFPQISSGTKLVLRSSLTRLVWSTCSAFEAHNISNSAMSALAPLSSPERSKFCRVCRAPGIVTFSWIFIAKKNTHGHEMRPRKTVKGNHWQKQNAPTVRHRPREEETAETIWRPLKFVQVRGLQLSWRTLNGIFYPKFISLEVINIKTNKA